MMEPFLYHLVDIWWGTLYEALLQPLTKNAAMQILNGIREQHFILL